MDFDELYPKKWLSAVDIRAAGGAIIDTIKGVSRQDLPGKNGNERKVVLNLTNNKPFICNVVNARFLKDRVGRDTEDWLDAKIKLQMRPLDKPFGDVTEGIRITAARGAMPQRAPSRPSPVSPPDTFANEPPPAMSADEFGASFDDTVPY
jgi:hypothetical protein